MKMKGFLFMSALFLFSFEGTTGQDHGSRLAAFLNDSLVGLPNWMREHGHVPDRLRGGGSNFTLTIKGENGHPFYNLTGEIKNRYYHGGDKNIRALDIQVFWSSQTFTLDLAFGDGENDFIEGMYSLNGTVNGSPVNRSGIFRNTQQLISPLHVKITCEFSVNRDGYVDFRRHGTGLYKI